MWKKKFNVLFLVVVLVMTMSGCSQSQVDNSKNGDIYNLEEIRNEYPKLSLEDEKKLYLDTNGNPLSFEKMLKELEKKLKKYVDTNKMLKNKRTNCFDIIGTSESIAGVLIYRNVSKETWSGNFDKISIIYKYNSNNEIADAKIVYYDKMEVDDNVNPALLDVVFEVNKKNEEVNETTFKEPEVYMETQEEFVEPEVNNEYDFQRMLDAKIDYINNGNKMNTIANQLEGYNLHGLHVTAGSHHDYDDFKKYKKVVTFGKYQDEPIEWYLIGCEKDENEIRLMSKNILDVKCFSNNDDGKWDNSYLRSWLNNDFYNQAFSSEEKKSIIDTNYSTKKNNFSDKVSIYNIARTISEQGGINVLNIEQFEDEIFKPTSYASSVSNMGSKLSKPYPRFWILDDGKAGRASYDGVSKGQYITSRASSTPMEKNVGVVPVITIKVK